MDGPGELELLRAMRTLRVRLRAADEQGAVRLVVRETRAVLGARRVQLVRLGRSGLAVEWAMGSGPDVGADDVELTAYLRRGEWPRPPADRLVAPVPRRGRAWGVLVADGDRAFADGIGFALHDAAELLAERLAELDLRSAQAVRARLDGKLMDQLRPLDLCYQILHGLRSLTGYDHSGSLYVIDGGPRRWRLAAEQVAWSKRKSVRIGIRVDLGGDDSAIGEGGVSGFDRAADGGFHRWLGSAPVALADRLAAHGDGPPAGSVLLAPLAVGGAGPLGAVVLAGSHPGRLAGHEADLLDRFLPYAALAIRNAHRAESLRDSVVRAERKHAMADLARGVAHDVNNALGSVLPVLQQLRVELAEGAELPPAVLADDLRRVEEAVATCRRIFHGMLGFARGAAGRGARRGLLRQAVAAATTLVGGALLRSGIEFSCDLPGDMPALLCSQHDLDQLVFNLMANACDAMPDGGSLCLRAQPADGARWLVEVQDSGRGMAEAELLRIEEAFYSTKPDGHGLGLAICRSIVTDVGGSLRVHSRAGEGTRVELELPALPGGGERSQDGAR